MEIHEEKNTWPLFIVDKSIRINILYIFFDAVELSSIIL